MQPTNWYYIDKAGLLLPQKPDKKINIVGTRHCRLLISSSFFLLPEAFPERSGALSPSTQFILSVAEGLRVNSVEVSKGLLPSSFFLKRSLSEVEGPSSFFLLPSQKMS